jgi:hypothetical protein
MNNRRTTDIPDPLKTRIVGYIALFSFGAIWILAMAQVTGFLL